MSSKPNNVAPRLKIVNPRYAGATPEDVARALLRPVSGSALTGSVSTRTRRKAIRGSKVAEQEPAADKGGRNKRHLRGGV